MYENIRPNLKPFHDATLWHFAHEVYYYGMNLCIYILFITITITLAQGLKQILHPLLFIAWNLVIEQKTSLSMFKKLGLKAMKK